MRRGAFVSRDWLGPVLAAVVSSSALVGDPGEAATLVVLAVATCFGWSAVARALLAGRRLSDARRGTLLRRVCIAQCLSVAVFWAVSMTFGHLLPAVAVLVAGTALSVLVWPWRWRLAQAAGDRGRSHDRALLQQHLTAAGILLVLAAGSAVALSVLACVLLLALTTSSLVDAWDEWRRPRALRAREVRPGASVPSGIEPARAVAAGSVLARDPARRSDPARASDTAGVQPQDGAERTTRPAHGSRRRRRVSAPRRWAQGRSTPRRSTPRRSAPRYTGRRVATRRS